jgi:glycosyltransferase involved in cell wall biosynthesis
MTTPMHLTVIVCTYNRARLLRDCLSALQAQKVPPTVTFDVTVVDNNSHDDTRTVVDTARDSFPVPVQYLFEPQQGKTHALNRGIAATTSDVIAFTDDDCRPEPEWLVDLAAAMTTHAADAVGGRILPVWPSPPPPWILSDSRISDSLAVLSDAEVRVLSFAQRERDSGFRVWGANMAWRRSVFADVGLFSLKRGPRGTRHSGGEESELITRALNRGKHIVFDPRPTVRHQLTPDRMRKAYIRATAFSRGESDAEFLGLPPRHLLGIPPYLVRVLAGGLVAWLAAVPRGPIPAFHRELEFIEMLGYLSGFTKQALQMRSYLQLRRAA